MKAIRYVIFGVSALLAAIAGCSGASDENPIGPPTTRAVGFEGGACPPSGASCEVGLVCLSNLCVKPGTSSGGTSSGGTSSGGAGTGTGTTDGTDAGKDAGEVKDSSTTKDASDGGECVFQHPLLDAGARFCSPGHCYCASPDSCYATGLAQACCSVTVVCY